MSTIVTSKSHKFIVVDKYSMGRSRKFMILTMHDCETDEIYSFIDSCDNLAQVNIGNFVHGWIPGETDNLGRVVTKKNFKNPGLCVDDNDVFTSNVVLIYDDGDNIVITKDKSKDISATFQYTIDCFVNQEIDITRENIVDYVNNRMDSATHIDFGTMYLITKIMKEMLNQVASYDDILDNISAEVGIDIQRTHENAFNRFVRTRDIIANNIEKWADSPVDDEFNIIRDEANSIISELIDVSISELRSLISFDIEVAKLYREMSRLKTLESYSNSTREMMEYRDMLLASQAATARISLAESHVRAIREVIEAQMQVTKNAAASILMQSNKVVMTVGTSTPDDFNDEVNNQPVRKSFVKRIFS